MKSRFVPALLLILALAGLQSMFAQSSANVVYTFPLDGITQSHYSHGEGPRSLIGGEGHCIRTLVPRQDLIGAEPHLGRAV